MSKSTVNDDWLVYIKQELQESKELDYVPSPSIFLAPSPLRGLKLHAFIPQVVAIGPYHSDIGPHHSSFPETAESQRYKYIAAKEMEKYKIMAAKETARRFRGKQFSCVIEEVMKVIQHVRDQYDSDLDCKTDEKLAYILSMDASFIIEVLKASRDTYRSISSFGSFYSNRFPRPLRKSIIQDFMLLENQVPLFLLKHIMRMQCVTDEEAERTLGSLISYAAYEVLPFTKLPQDSVSSVSENLGSCKHLLDCLYRIATFPDDIGLKPAMVEKPTHFPPAVELHNSGVNFCGKPGNVMQVSFDAKKGTLSLPKVRVGDDTEKLFRNLVAYESHLVDKVEILSFLRFMNCLIDTPQDVALLVEKGIIEQDIGSNEEVAEMWNNLSLNTMRVCSNEYNNVALALERHCKVKLNALMAEFKRTYLSRPWLVVSLVSGVSLLIMTFLTMWYTMEMYYKKI